MTRSYSTHNAGESDVMSHACKCSFKESYLLESWKWTLISTNYFWYYAILSNPLAGNNTSKSCWKVKNSGTTVNTSWDFWKVITREQIGNVSWCTANLSPWNITWLSGLCAWQSLIQTQWLIFVTDCIWFYLCYKGKHGGSLCSLWRDKCSINEIMKTHNSQSKNPCCIKFTLTDAVCITVEWLTDQSMVRAAPTASMKSCPGAECGKLTAHIFIPLRWLATSYVSLTSHTVSTVWEWPLIWVSVPGQAQRCADKYSRIFTTAQHAVIHPAELTVWPHVFTSCRRHCWQTDTHLHTGTPTHTDKRANRPPTAPPHQQNPVKCSASPRQDEIEIKLTVHAILSQVQCICLCDGGQQATA